MKNIIELRNKTGAGVMACKEALLNSNNDIEKAIIYLRKKGEIEKEKRAAKSTNEGIIGFYIHSGDKMAAMVELNSETDFVAKNEKFREFAHELALQVAASNPKWVRREDVPAEEIEKEKSVISGLDNKPAHIIEKIINGKLEKFFKDMCLMEQQYVKDPNITIKDIYNNLCVQFKENIVIKRFCRFQVG